MDENVGEDVGGVFLKENRGGNKVAIRGGEACGCWDRSEINEQNTRTAKILGSYPR